MQHLSNGNKIAQYTDCSSTVGLYVLNMKGVICPRYETKLHFMVKIQS